MVGAVAHLAEWRVFPHAEVHPIPSSLTSIPATAGVYALYDSSRTAIYVGQTKNLRAELQQTLGRKSNFVVRSGPRLSEKNKPKYSDLARYYSAYEVPSARLRHNLEALLLRVFPNQSHNNKLGEFH
jgi:excinuclease UvrABC nuclease subunit